MPAAAKILAENDVSPGQVAGSGRDGRITKGDALGAVGVPAPEARAGQPAAAPQAPAVAAARDGAGSATWLEGSHRNNACRCRVCARASPSV